MLLFFWPIYEKATLSQSLGTDKCKISRQIFERKPALERAFQAALQGPS
jgi:hypothetical protein